MVWPRIGENIYERLPLPKTKGMFILKIVTERRRKREAEVLQVN